MGERLFLGKSRHYAAKRVFRPFSFSFPGLFFSQSVFPRGKNALIYLCAAVHSDQEFLSQQAAPLPDARQHKQANACPSQQEVRRVCTKQERRRPLPPSPITRTPIRASFCAQASSIARSMHNQIPRDWDG